MAKSSNKNATKSFVMLIVTGVVLVAVTLCWFMLNKNTSVKELENVEVKNESSSVAKLYYGVNKKGDIAIERDALDGYEALTDNIIKLEDMVPGAEYFYVAAFRSCPVGYWVSLTFEDVTDGGLSDKITVYCDSVKTSKDDPENDEGYAETEAQNQLITSDSIIAYEKEIGSESNYFLYFSLKFADDATTGGEVIDANGTTSVDYRNKTINIGSVKAVLSSVPPSEMPEEEETTAEETTAEQTTTEETTVEETSSETNDENS